MKKDLQIEELHCDFAAFCADLGDGLLTGCVWVQAPKRNQPALMLSGIGRNAIGVDLDPKVIKKSSFRDHHIRDAHLHSASSKYLRLLLNMRVKW